MTEIMSFVFDFAMGFIAFGSVLVLFASVISLVIWMLYKLIKEE
jgi:hypothetical protein